MDTLYAGVGHYVIAFKKETGEEIWRTSLGGGFGQPFISLATDGKFVFAHTHGTLYCLNAETGEILWSNNLPGLGYGLASLCALANTPDFPASFMAQERKSSGS